MANLAYDQQTGRYKLVENIESSTQIRRTLHTQNNFLDKDIDVEINTPAGAQTFSGGGLTAGAGSVSLTSNGLSDGTDIDSEAAIVFANGNAAGRYKLTAVGSGAVNLAALTKEVTTAGFMALDPTPVTLLSATSLSSNTAENAYYIQQSTITQDTVNPTTTEQTVTITPGYYHEDRIVTVAAMPTATPTTSFDNTGLSTYFNAGTQQSNNVSITPRYSNEAGYVEAHTNANNGGIGYYNIKRQSITETTTTVVNSVVTRGARTEGVGWNDTAETLDIATFSLTPTTGVSYTDLSGTSAVPVLEAGGFIYIDAGWTDSIKISTAHLVPDGTNIQGHAEYLLAGKTALDENGNLITGNIPTYAGLGAATHDVTVIASTQTVTLPTSATYVNQNLTLDLAVQSNIGSIGGTATNGRATAVLNNVNSVNTLAASALTDKRPGVDYWQIKAMATTDAAQYTPKYTVTTPGWLQSTVEAVNPVNITVDEDLVGQSIYIPTIEGSTGFTTGTGTGSFNATVTPTIDRASDSPSVRDASREAGSVTTTEPSTGIYVAVKSAANTRKLTATPAITTNGYGTSAVHGISPNTATYGANASSVTYIPVREDTVTVTGGNIVDTTASITPTNATLSPVNTSGISFVANASARRSAIYPGKTTYGWVTISDETVALTGGGLSNTTSWNTSTSPVYLNSLEIPIPTTGNTNTLDIIVPDGLEGTMTFRFIVDDEGNVTLTDGSSEESNEEPNT